MIEGAGASRLPTARPRLASLTLSPFLHLAANIAGLVWLLFVTAERDGILALETSAANALGFSSITPQPELLLGIAWIPIGLTLLLDLIAGTQINAAILEYNGKARAAVAKARGGVQGDISNIPEREKEEIFGVLEGWELKSLRDTFALLTRQYMLLSVSLAPYAATIALFSSLSSHLTLPARMTTELAVLFVFKAFILLYWTYENVRIREVRLQLFRLD